jgi:HAD superfamily hydrolase (TIGR01490 family)
MSERRALTASSAMTRRGTGAFFDMDNTILSASSGRLYLRYLREIGYVSWYKWIYISAQVGLYILGVTDFPRLMSRLMLHAVGTGEDEAWRLSQAWFDTMLRHFIAPGAPERIAWHREQGHRVVIISAATQFAVQPVAQALGLERSYLATQLEIVNGHFTGRVIEPACYGAGKVLLAGKYAAMHGLDLGESYFYTDSHHDLPLLEAVGHPVAVNPDAKLRRAAARSGWPITPFY